MTPLRFRQITPCGLRVVEKNSCFGCCFIQKVCVHALGYSSELITRI
uniref:Uncharacterized protein n=1 Tax=Anguilla anguilla TaxID=7936 RepID=A0A0E9WDT1_ANGAN